MPIPKENLALLKGNRHKLTPQRKAIMRILLASPGHLTPAAIYEQVIRRNPRISLVTVYRTLNILAELGLVCDLRTGTHSKSYVAGNAEHHGHIICTNCGRVVDFTAYNLEDLEQQLAADSGYHISDHRLDLYGRCPACAASG